jgi:hypothetical protein
VPDQVEITEIDGTVLQGTAAKAQPDAKPDEKPSSGSRGSDK